MSHRPAKPDTKRDDPAELETQLIVRLPEEAAKGLRQAIREGNNDLKDRFNIKLDDLRYGEVQFDNFLYHAKVVDLPTIVESLKTIDNKSFYKTADICQLLICKDEPDAPSADDESFVKSKKKDPNKVDKKYLHPHGITPPCKNIRKRRFRKTLKKKNVEAPEIEKEVKRLLRTDNEAVSVKWELINEDDEPMKGGAYGNYMVDDMSMSNAETEQIPVSPVKGHRSGHSSRTKHEADPSGMGPSTSGNQQHVRQHDIFGEELSSSDEDDTNINEIDEASALSQEDSRMSSFSDSKNDLVTQFNRSMFTGGDDMNESKMNNFYEQSNNDSDDCLEPQLTREQIDNHVVFLKQTLDDLKKQREQKEQEIAGIANQTLRQRLQESLEAIMAAILDKEMELQELEE